MKAECEYCDKTDETVIDRDVEHMGRIYLVTICDECYEERFQHGL